MALLPHETNHVTIKQYNHLTMQPDTDIQATLDHLFRHESGRMVAVLTKLFGLSNVELAEDIVQETLIAALETWRFKGTPDNPRAWLYRVAKNRTLDYLRREQNFQKKIAPNISFSLESEEKHQAILDDFFLDNEIEDAQLRMLFACCPPSVPVDIQLVMMLKTLCGLSIGEIATAFLANEDTIAKRLYRAKEKIKSDGLTLDVPVGKELTERLDAVLKAVYLLFNEGYYSTIDNQLLRRDLCEEALRLGQILSKHPLSNVPQTQALMALICFQTARFEARFDENCGIILLEHQNRDLWDAQMTQQAYAYFKASQTGEKVSTYHIEAAIASYHAHAASFETTNWQAIFYCYNLLFDLQPSPIVAFNRAIALGYAEGVQHGIEALLAVKGLEKSHFYHVALGDFHKKMGDKEAAQKAYTTALGWAKRASEKSLIERKLVDF
jgi:RNA polymerase sigma factor (sigma-70 family)